MLRTVHKTSDGSTFEVVSYARETVIFHFADRVDGVGIETHTLREILRDHAEDVPPPTIGELVRDG